MWEQFRYLKEDFGRWDFSSPRQYYYNFFEMGLWATFLYRLSRFLVLCKVPILKYPIHLLAWIVFKLNEIVLGVAISPLANIGPGLFIGHILSIHVHSAVNAGKGLSIGPGALLGQRGHGYPGAPQLGDHVYIGVGAKILGGVRLGNHAWVGANAVVVKDVPDYTTVGGVPAKVIHIRNPDESESSQSATPNNQAEIVE